MELGQFSLRVGWFIFSCFLLTNIAFLALPLMGKSSLPSLPLHPSTCPSASRAERTSSQLHIPSFGEKSHWFPICRLRVRVIYPHYLSRPDLFSLSVVLCFLGAMRLVYSKERALSEPSAICLEERLLRENRF